MNTKEKKRTLLLAGAFLLMFFAVLQSRRPPQVEAALKEAPVQTSTPAAALASSHEESSASAARSPVDTLLPAFAPLGVSTQGFFQRRLKMNEEEVVLPLSLVWRFSCNPPDRQSIVRHLSQRQAGTVLVSLERLDGDRAQLGRQRVAAEAFLGGSAVTLTVPHTAQARHVGFFICSDAQADGRCGGKEVFGGKNVNGDKILFFNHFVLFGDRMLTFDFSSGQKGYEQMKDFVKAQAAADETSDLVGRVMNLNSTVRSRPLQLQLPRIGILLPVRVDSCSSYRAMEAS